MPCVNQGNGKVENLNALKNWNEKITIENVLTEIKNQMVHQNNKKLPQPAEGASYWNTFLQ